MSQTSRLISGMIANATDSLPGLIVELWATLGGAGPIATTQTGSDGRFVFTTAAASTCGGLQLRVLHSNRLVAASPVEPADSFELRVTLAGLMDGSAGETGQFTRIAGHRMNKAAAAKLGLNDLLELHRILQGETDHLPDRVRAAFPDLDAAPPDAPIEPCAGERGQLALLLLAQRGWSAAAPPGDDNTLPAPLASWSRHYTAHVEVAYTLDTVSAGLADHALRGAAALPPAPAPPATELAYVLNQGTADEIDLGFLSNSLSVLNTGLPGAPNTTVAPDYVQRIGLLAEYALERYRTFGLRCPAPPGARLQARVWRIVYGGVAAAGETQPGWDHIRIGNALGADDLASTVPHEIFHRVQFRYNPTAAVGTDMKTAFREGGARFAEDCVNDAPNDYIRNGDPVFNQPFRSIVPFTNDAGTAFEPLVYEAGILWKYYSEQLGADRTEPAVGMDAHRALLEATATIDDRGAAAVPAPGAPIGYDPLTLRIARAAMGLPGDFDRFTWLDAARTELATAETTWGNYVVANLLHGTPACAGDTRFSYLEDHDPVPSHAQLWKLRAAVLPADAAALASGGAVTFVAQQTPPWSTRYYRIVPSVESPPALLRVALSAGGDAHPLTQVVLVGPAQQLVDRHRLDATNLAKVLNTANVQAIYVVVANRDTPGQHTLTVSSFNTAPLITATRWNSLRDRSYEINPQQSAWTWTSPDLIVDTDGDLSADPAVFFERNNLLKLRVVNRGDAPATDITASFWVRQGPGQQGAAAWIPLTDQDGAVQTATLQGALAPGAETWLAVNWAPPDDGMHNPLWCVKAIIAAAGDPNTDDKVVLSNFDNVVVDVRAA